MAPELITAKQAADTLTVSASTVKRLIRCGKLRAVKLSERCLRIDAASVRAYLRTSEVQPQVLTCQSGKIAIHGGSVSSVTGLSLMEALELAKKRLSSKPKRGANSAPR